MQIQGAVLSEGILDDLQGFGETALAAIIEVLEARIDTDIVAIDVRAALTGCHGFPGKPE